MDQLTRDTLFRAVFVVPFAVWFARHRWKNWRAWKVVRNLPPKGARRRAEWEQLRARGDRRWQWKGRPLAAGILAAIGAFVSLLLYPEAWAVSAVLGGVAGISFFLSGWASAPALPGDLD